MRTRVPIAVLTIACMSTLVVAQGTAPVQEHPRDVLGTVALGFVPTQGGATPEPPTALTLVIQSLPNGPQIRYRIADHLAVWDKGLDMATAHQNFLLVLPPGSYMILGLEVQAPSLSDKGPAVLITGGPSFAVPDQACVYVGRIGFVFLRLPPASFAKSKAMVQAIAEERGLKQIGFYYSVKGALVVSSTVVDTPPDWGRTWGDDHGAKHYTEALAKHCTVNLAQPN